MEPGVPQRFAGIDIADSRNVRLVQQEIFQRALRTVKQFAESDWCETARERIDAQNGEPGAFCDGFPSVHSAEMAPVRKPENALLQFQRDIHMNAAFCPVGAHQKFLRIRKPDELAVQTEVHRQQAAVQKQKHILPVALDRSNSLTFRKSGKMDRSLRFSSNRVQDVNTPDALSTNQGTQSANHGFYFREFRHGNKGGLRPWL